MKVIDRRLSLVLLALVVAPTTVRGGIDRHALVTRHNLEWNDPRGQVPLGNGEFCFKADATGLQTFGGSTLSRWAWHSAPPCRRDVRPPMFRRRGQWKQGAFGGR